MQEEDERERINYLRLRKNNQREGYEVIE